MSIASLCPTILEALPQPISVVDAGNRMAYANRAFWRVAGVEPATCPPGSPLRDLLRLMAYRGLFGAGDPERQLAAVLALDRSRPLRRQVTLADGSRAFEIFSVPLEGGGFVSCAHDVTALVRGRQEQAARAGLLDATLNGLRGGVVRFDADIRVALCNPSYETLLGLPGGTIRPGMSHREVIDLLEARGEFDSSIVPEDMAARIAGNRKHPGSSQRRRPTGQVLRFDSQPSADGGFVTEVTDVTALQHAEDEARRRAAMLDGVLEALPHAVCVYGPDRRVQMFNAAYRRMMADTPVTVGEPLEAIIARRLASGEYDDAAAESIRARFAPGVTAFPTTRRVRPNGMAIENCMAPMPDGGVISVFTDVTALHRAEEAARHRAEMLDAVLEAMPHGVCVYGPDRRVAMFNKAYGRIMEGAEIAVGDHIELVVSRRVEEGEYDAAYAGVTMARSSVPAGRTEEVVRRRGNGTVIAVRTARLPDGGHISVVTDVTALHIAEEAARERAELLDAVLDALPEGVVVYGADGRARMTNPAYRRLLGDAAVHIGETFEEMAARHLALGEQDPEQVTALVRRHHGPRAEADRPIRRLRPDGTALVTRAGRLPDGGRITVVSDITPLHQAEAELRRRAAMQAAMLGTIHHGIVLFDADGRVLAANEKAHELIGIPPSFTLTGRTLDEVVAEQVARGQLDPSEAAAKQGLDRRQPQRYSRARPDGRVIDVVFEPTPDGGFVVTYSDVTDERAIRAEVERARALAEAASEAKSRFLATMSHELRTPLNAVIGLSEAIGVDAAHGRTREYAEMINSAGRQLLHLVDDILDVARSQTGTLAVAEEPLAPAAVIEAVAAGAKADAAVAGLELVVEQPPSLPLLRGDAARLRSVLEKLVSNAIKFTPGGGRVTLSAESDAQGLTIRVADTGIGIPVAERERMFEPFTQLDSSHARRFQGSGLGLHLARTLATALGGMLTLEGPEGPGIVAVLRFPASRLAPVGVPAARASRGVTA